MADKNHNQEGFKEAQRIANAQRPRLLTVKQASEWLGLTVWALRERCWNGDIPFVRFPGGRKLYFDIKDLEMIIERNKVRLI